MTPDDYRQGDLPARPEGMEISPYTEVPRVYPPYAVQYQEESDPFDLKTIYHLVLRNWWLILLFALVGIAGALYVNQTTLPIYQSAATIQIGTSQTEADPTGLGFNPYVPPSIDSDIEILRSRMLAGQVVDSLGLRVKIVDPVNLDRDDVFSWFEVLDTAHRGEYVLVRNAADGTFAFQTPDGRTAETVVPGEETALDGVRFELSPGATNWPRIAFRVLDSTSASQSLQHRLSVSQVTNDPSAHIVRIGYSSPDPRLAALVPNATADAFIDYRRLARKKQAANQIEFLTGQIDTLQYQLRQAEDSLRQYREANHVIDVQAEGEAKLAQTSQLETTRNQVWVQRQAVANLLARADSQAREDPTAPSPYRRIISYPAFSGNQALSDMVTNLQSLEQERAELLERRTRQDPDVQAITDRIHDIEGQLGEQARTYLAGLDQQLASLDTAMGRSQAALSEVPAKEVEFGRLKSQVDLLRQTYTLLRTRLKETQIAQAAEDPDAAVVDPALVPSHPVRPNRTHNLFLGLLVGLALGMGVSVLRDYFDNTIHTRDDLKESAGVPVLGLIPSIQGAGGSIMGSRIGFLTSGRNHRQGGVARSDRPSTNGETATDLVTQHDRNNVVAEAFRSLRTNITFSSAEALSKVFLLTSPTPKDGKTTTAANLCVTFAQQGLRVLLVDADMRRGRIHKMFRVPRTPGLSNILVEQCELEKAIRWVQLSDDTELDFLPTGTVPPNPAELLSSARMGWLLDRLRERYDAVVIDTPPLTLVTDAAVLSTYSDNVLLVARANETEEGAVKFAVEQLRNVKAPLRGTILNDVNFKRDSKYGGYGYYGYRYDYHQMDED